MSYSSAYRYWASDVPLFGVAVGLPPGAVCDVLVTDVGIAVNPKRPEVEERLKKAGLNIKTIQQLRDEAYAVVGKPDELEFGDKVVAVVTDPKGRALDVIYNVKV